MRYPLTTIFVVIYIIILFSGASSSITGTLWIGIIICYFIEYNRNSREEVMARRIDKLNGKDEDDWD